jgi:hypothetical protein
MLLLLLFFRYQCAVTEPPAAAANGQSPAAADARCLIGARRPRCKSVRPHILDIGRRFLQFYYCCCIIIILSNIDHN